MDGNESDQLIQKIKKVVRSEIARPNVYFGALWVWPFFLIAALFLLFTFASTQFQWEGYFVWASTTVGAVMVSIVTLFVAERRFFRTGKVIERIFVESHGKIEKSIINYMTSSIIYVDSKDDLRDKMRNVLDDFAKSDIDELYILGADKLAPSLERMAQLDENDTNNTPSESVELLYGRAYQGIFSQSARKNVHRYIKLFEPEEIVIRTVPFIREYRKWLDIQLSFLNKVPGYRLVDSPRAPVWGAPKSTIMTEKVIAEIFFSLADEAKGTIIESADVTKNMRKDLVDGYIVAKDSPPYKNYTSINRPEFEGYIKKITDAVTTAKKLV